MVSISVAPSLGISSGPFSGLPPGLSPDMPVEQVFSVRPTLSIEEVLSQHPGFRLLLCSDVFTFDFNTLQLRILTAPFNNVRHPTLGKAAALMVQSHQVPPYFFFTYNCLPAPRHQPSPHLTFQQRIDLNSFAIQVIQPVETPNANISSTKHYKSLLPLPKTYIPSPLTSKQWKSFWSLDIPLPSRTTWFRLLHKKISCKQILNKIIPNQYPSPLCTICDLTHPPAEESLDHMFFLCPPKQAIWLNIFSSYINSSIQYVPNDLIHILKTICSFADTTRSRTPNLKSTSLSIEQILACTL